jgi:hypothetical protein
MSVLGFTAQEVTDALTEFGRSPEFQQMYAEWRLCLFLTADDKLLKEVMRD